ncbi:MAG: FecR domain-containing protein [Fulvivirga sp.]
MDYNQYKVEDFVLDQRFRKWVMNPDKNDHLYWEEWLESHPHQVERVNEARALILRVPRVDYKFNTKDKNDLWQSILRDRVGAQSNKKNPPIIPLYGSAATDRSLKRLGIVAWRAAAVVSVLLVISFLLFERSIDNAIEKETAVEKIVKENPLGQKSTIFLRDGSEIILNSGSRITYDETFGKTERQIYLEGEAFFKVAKNKHLPFKVFANGLVTTALGTSFNVKAYKEGENTKVTLLSGSVLVHNSTKDGKDAVDPLMLIPGEQAIYASGERKSLTKNTFDVQLETGWKDGIIVFKDESADNVFSYLEKWYGVKIAEVNQSSKKWNYSGQFQNMSLHGVLTSIGFTMGFEFLLKENNVKIIHKK